MDNWKTQFMLNIDREGFFKRRNCPSIMSLVNKYNEDWNAARPETKALLTKYIENHIGTELNERWGTNYSTEEFVEAALTIAEHDFFKKGLIREKIALEALMKHNPDSKLTRDTSIDYERMGVDIYGKNGNGETIAISVKGKKFPSYGIFKKHKLQLRNTAIELNAKVRLLCVDENTKEIKRIDIEGDANG